MDGPPPRTPLIVGPRVAWVCNWLDPSLPEEAARLLNFADTTVAFLMRQEPAARVEKLIGLVRHNAAALTNQARLTAALPPARRAMRLATHFLPCYSHPAVRPLYDDPALREVIEEATAPIGPAIKAAGIRISMHPGQYCVLATESDAVRKASVDEVEYHVHVMRLLGHAGGWHPHGAHVNVHGGGRAAGIEAFRAALNLLSEDARGLLTVENDEIAYGLDDLLPVADSLPIVLDIHHHWVMTGEYIAPDDPRVARVIASWRGVRPIAHVSSPREVLAEGMDPDALPDRAALVEGGANIRDLRMHSARLWNRAHAAWAAGHLAWADIEVEAKDKNLATQDFAVAAGLVEFVPEPPPYVKPVRTRKAKEATEDAPPEPPVAAARGRKGKVAASGGDAMPDASSTARAGGKRQGRTAPGSRAPSDASAAIGTKVGRKGKIAAVRGDAISNASPTAEAGGKRTGRIAASGGDALSDAAPATGRRGGRGKTAAPVGDDAAPTVVPAVGAERGRKGKSGTPGPGATDLVPASRAATAESAVIPKPSRDRKPAANGAATASHTLVVPKGAAPDPAGRRGRPRAPSPGERA